MFGKLLSKIHKDKTVHPLATDAGVDAIVAAIARGNPIQRLKDLEPWLADPERFVSEVSLPLLCRAILRLDGYAKSSRKELFLGYLAPDSLHHLSEAAWGQIEAHIRILTKTYRFLLKQARSGVGEKPPAADLASCAARAMWAMAMSKKLQRFRYRAEIDWWREAHELLGDAAALGVLDMAVQLYDNPQQVRSPLQCYLVGAYLELAPLANLVPQQVEVLDRFLELNLAHLDWQTTRQPGSTHAIDLSAGVGPVKLAAGELSGGNLHYFSVARLQRQAGRLAAQLASAPALPVWVQRAWCDKSRLQGLLMAMILNWSDRPPERAASRAARGGQLKVVHGFALARRMLSYSAYARHGVLPDYDDIDLTALFAEGSGNDDQQQTAPTAEIYYGVNAHHMFNENRFGSIDTVKQPEVEQAKVDTAATAPDSKRILEQLESGVARQELESWQLIDESATGIGAVAPGLLARHGVGGLVCFRHDDELDWHLGFIRRIGRDAKKRPSIGIQILAGDARCATVNPPDDSVIVASGIPLRRRANAILPKADTLELLLPVGTYKENAYAELGLNEDKFPVVLTSMNESGSDFERVEFGPAL